MKFADHLSDIQKRQLEKIKSPKKKAIKLAETKMSRREVEELMGMNRDIYTRKNGAVRRK